jgi:hypothetical protein
MGALSQREAGVHAVARGLLHEYYYYLPQKKMMTKKRWMMWSQERIRVEDRESGTPRILRERYRHPRLLRTSDH